MSAVQLSAADVLALWDRGQDPRLTEPERTLLLSEAPSTSMADVPIGRVVADVLRLRAALLGPELAATVECPSCDLQVEFGVSADVLLELAGKIEDHPAPLVAGDDVVTWRPPSYADLVALARAGDVEGRAFLLRRCVLEWRHHEALAEADLPENLRDAVVEAMATADPLAELRIDMTCPECGRAFETGLDVGGYVWAELDSQARTLVLEIDALARTYGWSQEQILALSEARRARYLALITQEPA